MSYILEALKKSEQERHIGHVPDLTMTQEPAPSVHAARGPWLLPVALLLNAVIIGLVVWRPWQTQVAAVVEAERGASPEVAETASPEPVEPATTDAVVPASVAVPPVSAPRAAAPVEVPVASEPTVHAGAGPQPEAPSATPVRSPSDWRAATPRWQDLPAEERSRLPVPRFDVHVFAQEPSRRFVLVNLKKYQEGDRLDQGVTLDAILADGVVLSYQGQRYRVDRP